MKIKFFTNNKKLLDFPELYPQPAKNFIPKWYKDMPISTDISNRYNSKLIPNIRTIKTCPSYMDIFNEGFVLVAPCDIWLRVEEDGTWEWRTAHSDFVLEHHNDEQYINHIPNTNVKSVFKIIYPWFAVTPKGYSVRQMPMMYDYENTDWLVPYGVIKTDKHYTVNQQIFYTSDKNEVLIKRGQPLNYCIPYKRDKFTMQIDTYEKHKNELEKQNMYVNSSFRSNYHRFEN